MILTHAKEHSEIGLMEEVYKLADAGASVIQIRSREPIRTAMVLRKNILMSEDSEYKEWDTVNGFRTFTRENYVDHRQEGGKEDFVEALEDPLRQLRDSQSGVNLYHEKIHYYAFIDPHPFMANNPYASELIQQYAAILSTTNVVLLFVTPQQALDGIPAGTVLVADMHTPSAQELESALESIIDKSAGDFEQGSDLTEDDVRKLSYLGLGMTMYEFETYSAIAIIEANTRNDPSITYEALSAGIAQGKTAVVKQSDILELIPTASMNDVGGMQRLKDWVESRSGAYSDEAKEYGIEPPKGAVVVGVPGTGKSLVAKAIASSLGIPAVKLDFSRVFSKYIGDSESRVRAALQMAEDMAPVLLFADELDKGLGGAGGGGGDNGTSSRVLGTFLTWLQECKAPVFVMATANRVDGLPPELLRRGRFDQIFSIGLPTDVERLEVLNIHLRKRGKKLDFTKDEIYQFTTASREYVPAEIESAVKDALISAFNEKKPLGMQHILDALKDMVPMSRSNAAAIARMVDWAKDNATPVNYDNSVIREAMGAAPQRRMRRVER